MAAVVTHHFFSVQSPHPSRRSYLNAAHQEHTSTFRLFQAEDVTWTFQPSPRVLVSPETADGFGEVKKNILATDDWPYIGGNDYSSSNFIPFMRKEKKRTRYCFRLFSLSGNSILEFMTLFGCLVVHFKVVCSMTSAVTWPLRRSEDGGDLVLIQTSLFFLCKRGLVGMRTTQFTWEKQWGLYQNKVFLNLASIRRQGYWEHDCKMNYCLIRRILCFICLLIWLYPI